jgi:hypothetical protein
MCAVTDDQDRQDASVARMEAAIELLGRAHPEAAAWVQAAADWLTAGEGADMISQSSLQELLWNELPRKSARQEWPKLLDGAASLLDELDLHRYAAIVRSSTTRDVLAAWRKGRGEGFEAYRAATDASGIDAPDTDLLRWGSVMGIEDALARERLSRVLETAIVSGGLRPGASGWRAKASLITRQALLAAAPAAPDGPMTQLDAVLAERVETWVSRTRSQELGAWRRRAVARLMRGLIPTPPDAPRTELVESVTSSMIWLLDACRDGVKATVRGFLPPALVREGAERFGWWPCSGAPRSELDVHQLLHLHEIAQRERWLGRRSGRIKTTRSGVDLAADPAALWRMIAATVGREDPYSTFLSELIAHRLLEGPAETHPTDGRDELVDVVAPIVVAEGWRHRDEPPGRSDVDRAIHVPLREWRLFGLLAEEHPRWIGDRSIGRWTTALTEAGRATALAHLHARATEARNDVFG